MRDNDYVKRMLRTDITFVFNYNNNKWYVSLKDIVSALTDVKNPSTYWAHLKERYNKKGIELDLKVRELRMYSPDKRIRKRKVLSLDDAISLIKILNTKRSKRLIENLNKVKPELELRENTALLSKIIKNYQKQKYQMHEIKEIINEYIDNLVIIKK